MATSAGRLVSHIWNRSWNKGIAIAKPKTNGLTHFQG